MRRIAHASLGGALVMLAACSGDDRPFEEAVELEQAGVTALQIVAPANADDPLVIGVGGRIDLGLLGLGPVSGSIDFDDSDREWRSLAPSIASVDRNGLVTGLADGSADILVSVGSLTSAPFTVRVSGEPLVAIASIDGEAMPDPCVATRYAAVGRFADQSTRTLTQVSWSLAAGANGSLRSTGEADAATSGAIDLVPAAPGALTLVANSGGFELRRTLSVPDSTLTELRLPAGLQALNVGATLDLTATGIYERDGATLSRGVTDTVRWSVLSGSEAATVSDAVPTRGQVTGQAAGNATIQAACGAVTAEVVVGVSADSSSDDDGLSIEQGSTLSLATNGPGVQLRVSTGSDYDEDDDVTTSTNFSSDNAAVASVILSGARAGFVTPGSTSGTARIFAERNSESAVITITVR